jgi:large subunit ribosomal protein L13
MNTTYSAKPCEVARNWYVVDATGQHVGRLASRIAQILRGTHKPQFTPHVDTGDFVVVVNATQVEFTGRKLDTKFYHHYTGYPGGIRSISARMAREHDPELVLREAVAGMLPKNRLARQLIKKLKVYGGADHPHAAQAPQTLPDTF